MNARESLAADRVAEHAWERANQELGGEWPYEYQIASALVSIAAELRAARVYANYLEGRRDAEKRRITEREALS